MSSLDFLNELKTMKFSSNTFKKGDTNIDYGLTTYEPLSTLNKYTTGTLESDGYKYDYQNYATTLTDERNRDNDLIVVGQRIEAQPSQNDNQRYLDD